MEKELIFKAKGAKTPEELMAIAKEDGTEMTEKSARAYFELLHPATGELSDDELDNVAGGGCYTKDGRLVVSATHKCKNFKCVYDGGFMKSATAYTDCCSVCKSYAHCGICQSCVYEKGLWLCTNENKIKN